MAIADLAQKTELPWQTCGTCHLLDSLTDDKAAQLLELLSNSRVRYSKIADELETDPEWGVVIEAWQLSRHARGVCSAKVKLRAAKAKK